MIIAETPESKVQFANQTRAPTAAGDAVCEGVPVVLCVREGVPCGVGEPDGVRLGVPVGDTVAESVPVRDVPKDAVCDPVPVTEGIDETLGESVGNAGGKATPVSVNLLNFKLPAPWQPEQFAAPMPMQSPACPSASEGRGKLGNRSLIVLTGKSVVPLALGRGAQGPAGPQTEY